MDYKELIGRYRLYATKWENGEQLLLNGEMRIQDTLREAATAIETLLAERDEAVNDLREVSDCTSCKFYEGDHPECANCGAFLEEWQWRGPQKGDEEK